VTALLEHTSVLFPNTPELLALTGEADVDAAAAYVVSAGCRVALKNGADGGIFWDTTGVRVSVPAPRTEVVDTTGAGDSFDAGFISAMLDGLTDERCLERAVRCGSLSTRAVGGTAAQATRADLA
jgi:ribokinase